ncbi:hypothetical protein [Bradyrhizobium sp. BRP56]|uniref:hypothetical protein n=1 Tax=Bradyrhizobium sp. BRP56 TaxID=2793819 RepID=UPI001CD5E5AF|nr:hypothetical protein [Bradyrhizobium sp. BRP56]
MAEGSDGQAKAQQAAGVTRKTLERLALPGDDRELVVAEVTYPPGGVAPLHRHPVGGVVFIVEGMAESAYGDPAPRQYRQARLCRIDPRFRTRCFAIATRTGRCAS